MPNFYKILVLLATLVFLVFLIAPDFPRKIFSFSKLLINEYVPTHTEKSMQKRLTKEASKIKKDALDAFLPHINIESLNLTLKKLPKTKLAKLCYELEKRRLPTISTTKKGMPRLTARRAFVGRGSWSNTRMKIPKRTSRIKKPRSAKQRANDKRLGMLAKRRAQKSRLERASQKRRLG